ncbi:antitoxin Xre/MbcA/ParS toxin-binding domain-containing protein [Bradyrhizobium sp. DASA03120]|uniref:antitoxin Xre/MbcA/ParS toxin-binding domain-containing protein n=1 Tax=Bradyrhizobium sp. SMVTL-02 TaxID=3395917 RepID=UPI003F704A8F
MQPSSRTETTERPHGGHPTPLEFFFKLAEIWDLSTEQQIKLLGSPARSTYFRWRKDGGDVSVDTLERISHLGSIYKALSILLDSHEAAVRWIRRPNRYFDGATALDVMLSGNLSNIIRVRQYVDAQRGG